MNAPVTTVLDASVVHDQVSAVAQEVFAAMVDGDAGLLLPWEGELPVLAEPVVAWVDLHGDWAGRLALRTGAPTANALARALLGLPDEAEVSHADLVDACGEVANVVGGNFKSLLPGPGTLGLPQVGDVLPQTPGALRLQELPLAWRGQLLAVEVWSFGAQDAPRAAVATHDGPAIPDQHGGGDHA